MRFTTRDLAMVGLMGSMTCVATLFFKVPGPFGYYHLGDGIIYLAAWFFGPVTGALVGAIGSSGADLIGGFAVWAPWTLVIKGLTGYLVGRLARKAGNTLGLAGAMAVGAMVTIVGYALVTSVLYSPEAVVIELYGNLVQTGAGIVIALLGATALRSRVKSR